MHSKLMLFRFVGCVRLVVSSFNFSQRQWDSAGDSFWWVDLPLSAETATNVDPMVQAPLMDTLRRLGVGETGGWLTLLNYCNWSALQHAASKVHLITSIPGGDENYGIQRLRSVLIGLPKFPSSSICP